MRVRGDLSPPPHSHAWLTRITISNYARLQVCDWAQANSRFHRIGMSQVVYWEERKFSLWEKQACFASKVCFAQGKPVTNEKVNEITNVILQDRYSHAFFVSPSLETGLPCAKHTLLAKQAYFSKKTCGGIKILLGFLSYENGYSPRPNCTPTACVVWFYCMRKPGMRARGDKPPLTLIPGYLISPLTG